LHSYEADGKFFQARIIGVNAFGKLVMQDIKGVRSEYDFKEIKFLMD
jgi:hypothetical protein